MDYHDFRATCRSDTLDATVEPWPSSAPFLWLRVHCCRDFFLGAVRRNSRNRSSCPRGNSDPPSAHPTRSLRSVWRCGCRRPPTPLQKRNKTSYTDTEETSAECRPGIHANAILVTENRTAEGNLEARGEKLDLNFIFSSDESSSSQSLLYKTFSPI